ncbi:MAG: SRPBCC domain-containing protein [Thaumarchaeota archaeon]|nr:SRPBCC domain-containing protein [Nitrososphaerota archaeon]
MGSIVRGRTVVKEIEISKRPDVVYRALTLPALLNRWFTHGSKVDLRVGGGYENLDGDRGTFIEITPNSRLRFTWDNPNIGAGSVVEVLLARSEKGTILTLVHSGFRRKEDFDHYASKESGWNWALQNLKALLEGRRLTSYEKWLAKTR